MKKEPRKGNSNSYDKSARVTGCSIKCATRGHVAISIGTEQCTR
jgi:hypothetical protein